MAEDRFVSTTGKDQYVKTVVEVIFVNIREAQGVRIVAGARFVSTTREDLRAKVVLGLKFVSTASKDQDAPHAMSRLYCFKKR